MSTRTHSKRVAKIEAHANQRQKQAIENKRQTERGKPTTCELCTRRARTRCRLCRECHKSRTSEESKLILCQGCPQHINANKLIRWIVDQPLLAFWIEKNLELSIERGSLHTPAKCIAIIGWKGGNDVDETKIVEGLSVNDWLIVDNTRIVFACLSIDLDKETTPRQLHTVINEFIVKLYGLKWESNAGRPLKPPEFSPGMCRTKNCPNAAYVFIYCAGCCRVRYGVEVKKSTLNAPDVRAGLGLFACKTFQDGGYVCDYTWDMQEGREGFTLKRRAHGSVWIVCIGGRVPTETTWLRCGEGLRW